MDGDAPRLLIGTSGWSYSSWHGDFYPSGLARRDELRYLAEHTSATEVNATFYRLQRPDSFRHWRSEIPDDHRLAVKGSRYLTHMRRLRDPGTGIANFLASGVLALGGCLDTVLWQLPQDFPFDVDVLAPFVAALPRTAGAAARVARGHDERLGADAVVLDAPDPGARLRHAVEPRHESFACEEADALFAAHDVAVVHSDTPGDWPVFDRDTASFRYVRLHGHSALYASRYSDASLDAWARRCRAWTAAGQDVQVYFDNDARGHAPHDAVRLLARLREADHR